MARDEAVALALHPQLAHTGIDDRESQIHEPGAVLGYVAPMVDHAVEREESLRRYGVCQEQG